MPSLEADLRSHLLGDDYIAGSLADTAANESRLWPEMRPADNKNLPALVYHVIACVPQNNLEGGAGGDSCLENARVQLDVWAKSHDQAITLRDLVIARLRDGAADKSLSAVLNFRSSDFDPDTRERREILDFSIWHQTA